MENVSLAPLSHAQEEKLVRSLKQAIARRKAKLTLLVTKLESLQVELDLIEHEYYVRIGNLLLQDNELDLQIIRYKNIISLMKEGKSYDEALMQIEGQFFDEILKEQEEKKRIHEEQQSIVGRQEIPDEELTEMKNLWKKLIRQFHPDLVSNPQEKQSREKIMQQINMAYAENNLDKLQQIALQPHLPVSSESSLTDLEKTLEETIQLMNTAERSLEELKKSQWYTWRTEMKKAKKEGKDVFVRLENSLIDDLLKKIALARQLQEEITFLQHGSSSHE